MKKGLTLTLMTVALAMLGFQAMAMAPVIGEIPNPVVSNAENATGPNQFVFPDAINLNTFVTDDNTTVTDLKWSYTVAGEATYKINGHDPLDLSTENPNDPQAKQINNAMANNELDPDSNPATITIRNVKISPLNPTTSDTVPAMTDASQVVTLIASDGAAYSTKDIICYTDLGGDRMSPGVEIVHPGSGDYNGWATGAMKGWAPDAGNVTFSTSNGAMCIDTAAAGNNMGSYANAYGDIPIQDGYVYHIRANMTGSQATPGHTPFWDMTIANPTHAVTGDSVPFRGYNVYGCDAYFFDNQGTGGANAVTTTPRDFEIWWAPAPIDTAQWKAGAFTADAAADMQSQLTFRVMDVTNNPALAAGTAWGTLCVNSMVVERYPLSNMQKVSSTPVYSVTQFKDASGQGGSVRYTQLNNATVSWNADGSMTIQPTINGNQQVELVNVFPSTDTNIYDNGATGAGIADDFPVTWENDTLYQIKVDMQAKDATAEQNPFDAFFINVSEPSNEVLYSSMFSAGGPTVNGTHSFIATPKVADGPQTYMAFFYSHKCTASTTLNYNRWRPTLQFASNATLLNGNNNGGVKISKIEVNKVQFK